jgi:hypothetical protein
MDGNSHKDQTGDDSQSSDEMAEDDSSRTTNDGSAIMNLLKKSSSLGLIEEEENDSSDDKLLFHIEKHAGSALDQAQQYIDDFEKSKVEVLPMIQGYLFAQGSLNKK